MALTPGVRLGPYEVVGPLGAGGMGEVYRARDTRLERSVAIKVLPAHLAADPARRARFEREAKVISALNHPHICVLHDVGRSETASGSIDYLVMEHIEGEPLSERLKSGRLPLEQALRTGIEVADALHRAHRAGIVHRDLKPSNVMLTKGGAKVLDFGLAKRDPAQEAPASDLVTATADAPLTGTGVQMGTLPYMAPELLEGRGAGVGSDLFAFGVMLYEMLTGRRPFDAASEAGIIAAILRQTPAPPSTLRSLPPALDRLVLACLARDPDERCQSARDVEGALRWIREDETLVAAPAVSGSRPRLRWPLLAAVLGVLLVSAWLLRAPPRAAPLLQVSLDLPMSPAFVSQALSPDGSRVAFVASSSEGVDLLWIRPLDAASAQPLAGTEGASMPFWSPDSRFVGFFAEGRMKRVDASGGPPLRLCDVHSPRGGAWSRDGVILFADAYSEGLSRVSAEGGAKEPVTRLAPERHDFSHRWPHFLPDGRRFLAVALFTNPSQGTETHALVAGEIGSPDVRVLARDASNAFYVDPGYLVYSVRGELMARPFDPSRGRFLQDAIALPGPRAAYMRRWGYAEFSASRNGVLLARGLAPPLFQPAWLDRSGRTVETLGAPGYFRTPRLSPDGKQVALVRFEAQTDEGDIWLYDRARDVASRFTLHPAYYGMPQWFPDGRTILFDSNLAGVEDVYKKRVGESSDPEPVLRTSLWKEVTDVSRDGRLALVTVQDSRTNGDVWALPLSGEATAHPVIQGRFHEQHASFSPDARFIAYQSDESGRPEIYVQRFAGSGGRWQVSRGGGRLPRWSGSGTEIFFVAPRGDLMAVDVRTAPEFLPGTPRRLFTLPASRGYDPSSTPVGTYDPTPDGKRFLVAIPTGKVESTIFLVVNWTTALPR